MFRAVILGAPASGKGTISSRIVKFFDIVHLSSGDLLRNEIKKGSELGVEANAYVTKGNLVPDELMSSLVFSQLELFESQNILLDGFPRTLWQAQQLVDRYPIQLAITLDVPVEEIIERVKGRWIHVASGRTYNETFNQPKVLGKDDVTGEDLEQRIDDSPEAVRLRLQLYEESVKPLVEFYDQLGILKVFSGRTSNEIWPKVQGALKDLMPQRQVSESQ